MQSVKIKVTRAIIKAIYEAHSQSVKNNYRSVNKQTRCLKGYHQTSIYRLKKQKLLTEKNRDGERILVLTKKGSLEALFTEALLPCLPDRWDGMWRVVIFDVPEITRQQRDKLRRLLKQNNYCMLQASVFISPHPLNRKAIKYLQDSSLSKYIRILRVNEMDNDKDLRIKYRLPLKK